MQDIFQQMKIKKLCDDLMKTNKIYEDFFDEISNDEIQDNSDDLIQQKFEYKMVLYVPVSFKP